MSYSVHVIVRGKVQGVGFRFFTQQLANKYHLDGWVRNLHDGNVEIHAEGKNSELDAFLEKLKSGTSPFAHVEQMIINTSDELKGYSSFKIKY
ncbi:acylphosphatase [Lederbergia lenta]|uniref:acylphosphatase n=1 Tax=Lederbergia lenta TaxID=1467 RepID=UPI00203F391B|nr:acylphosphatase [Lederbergia lenta]